MLELTMYNVMKHYVENFILNNACLLLMKVIGLVSWEPIFFISHDRCFINRVCSRLVSIEEHKLVNYEGNYDFYKNKKIERLQSVEELSANHKTRLSGIQLPVKSRNRCRKVKETGWKYQDWKIV
ncbi:MAG: transporter ATP-binding protein [Eubacterium sp.]|nr:transporter ATP-binding protein [Eubacterium sp.]